MPRKRMGWIFLIVVTFLTILNHLILQSCSFIASYLKHSYCMSGEVGGRPSCTRRQTESWASPVPFLYEPFSLVYLI